MPRYTITNPATGEKVTVEGSKPPTQADAQAIFTEVANRKARQTAPTQAAPAAPQQSTSQQGADFLGVGTTKNNIDTLWNFSSNVGGNDVGALRAGGVAKDAFKQSQALIEAAKQEPDKKKKRALLDQSKAIMEQSDTNMQGYQEDLTKRQFDSGITEKDMTRGNPDFALRRGLGMSGELASWLLPAKVAPIAAGARGRVITSGVRGAVGGTGQGVAGAAQADSVGEAAQDIVKGGMVGAGLGIGVQIGLESMKKLLVAPTKGVINWLSEKTGKQLDTDVLNDWKMTTTKDLRRNKFSDKEFIENLNQLNRGNKEGLYDQVEKKVAGSVGELKELLPEQKYNPKQILSSVLKKLKSEQKSNTLWRKMDIDEFVPDDFVNVSAEDLFNWKILVRKKGFGANGTVSPSDTAQFNAALNAEIKKVLIESAGDQNKQVAQAFRKLQLWMITQDAAEKFANSVGAPTSDITQRASWLSFIPQTLGAAGSRGLRAMRTNPMVNRVSSGVGSTVNVANRVGDSALQNSSMVVPPSIAAMQRALDEQRRADPTRR
jgi:hypothetical protein